MSEQDYVSYRRYTVTLRFLGGSSKEVRVITNRGEAKAVYLATSAKTRLVRGGDALDVEVRDDGEPELDAAGVPILRGYGFDRNEW